MRGYAHSTVLLVLLIGLLLGVLLSVAMGTGLALIRPEGDSVLRPWWR
jgi:hypothetical protein